ncbi:MAG: FeoB-associated Cys-rich membrane protein [Acutalibacteraceae bacterium]|nr:FeoB-associated Cys-rich membrane protein [Clostridia bacterium]MEE3403611.1 FeoB-associated Cys-rich membrane protein [Acutalibacteraceae bacterium]HCA56129.1 hypothetical protein [Oscillospiraceae bacterium]
MNIVEIILTVLIAAAVIIAFCVMRKGRKKGKGCCSCNCQNCSHHCSHDTEK